MPGSVVRERTICYGHQHLRVWCFVGAHVPCLRPFLVPFCLAGRGLPVQQLYEGLPGKLRCRHLYPDWGQG